jgi:hypothetical protein
MMPTPEQVWLVVEAIDMRAGVEGSRKASRTRWGARRAMAVLTRFATDAAIE